MADSPSHPDSPFSEFVWEALKSWHSADQELNTFRGMTLYRNVQRIEKGTARQATNLILKNGIDELAESYDEEAQLLEARFMNGASIQKLAHSRNVAESTVYTLQRNAIKRLANILELQEEQASKDHSARLSQRLEAATYETLVGVDSLVDKMLTKVTASTAPWIISIEGIGGIGKTSLAHTVLSAAIEQGAYYEIGWVTARQQHLSIGGTVEVTQKPALSAELLVDRLVSQLMPEYSAPGVTTEQQLHMLQVHLEEFPHLIVIDNLETVADVESLIPTLQKLTDPTRFILTSRESVRSYINIFPYSVPELGPEDSLMLIRHQARQSNLSELAEAGESDLRAIYDVAGGNPLALRLIVGQHHVHTLDEILADLTEVNHKASQNLYRYIYKQAWLSLDKEQQTVLKIMPLANPKGDDIDYLSDVSSLSVNAIRKELNRLVQLNLVDARGGLNERRYSIHGLTRAFLHKEVLGWLDWDNELVNDQVNNDDDSVDLDDE